MAIYFIKATKLYDIKRRSEYINDPERQEEIVVNSQPVDWSHYIEFQVSNKKQELTWSKKANKMVEARIIEGQEFIVSLPNEWYHDFKNYKMTETDLKQKIDGIAKAALTTKRTKESGKYPEFEYAAHFNKKGDINADTGKAYAADNFNLHIIFNQRLRVPENERGVYQRDFYLHKDRSGNYAKRKADRLQIKTAFGFEPHPPKHKKGDLKGTFRNHKGKLYDSGGFSSKDPQYDSRIWLKECKSAVKSKFEEYGIEFDPPAYFQLYKEGKGSDASKIKLKNKKFKLANKIISELEINGYTFPSRHRHKSNSKRKEFLHDVLNTESKNMRSTVLKYGNPQITKPQPTAKRINTKRFDDVFANNCFSVNRTVEDEFER